MKRLIIRKDRVDVSDDIELADGRANPFGWSSYTLVHKLRAGTSECDVPIGTLYCGEPEIREPGYTAEVVEEPEG